MSPKNLRASNLHRLSPYPLAVSESDLGIVYSFTNIHKITYKLVFAPDSEYLTEYPFADLVYSFSIAPAAGKEGPKDPMIGHTVAYALNQAFDANPELIITYICSIKDEKQRSRRILFGMWFRQHGEGFSKLEYTDKDSIYSAAIYMENHPFKSSISQAFSVIYDDK